MNDQTSFGVSKPVGHVVISFPSAEHADAAAQALSQAFGQTLGEDAVRRYTDRQMLQQIDVDLANASPWAAMGQELNLVRARRELAAKGYHFLIVHAPDDEQAAQVAEIARGHGAERAQSYGRFIIEELIEPPGELTQVGESPDRGLDAQTPSGIEGDAAPAPANTPPR